MELPEILLSIGVIAIGVAVIAYILLRTPKKPASIGDEGSISLGEADVPAEAEDAAPEADTAPEADAVPEENKEA